jgi:hypothetical protein
MPWGVALLLLTLLVSRIFGWTVVPAPTRSIFITRHLDPAQSLHHGRDDCSSSKKTKKTILCSSRGDGVNDTETTAVADTAVAATGPTVSFFSSEELATIEAVFDQCEKAKDTSDDELRSTLLTILPTLSPSLLLKLRDNNNNNNDVANNNEKVRAVSMYVNAILERQLDMAKTTLSELLNAGEIRKLDALIGKALREGRLDAAFFNVLTANLKDAASTAGASSSSNAKHDKTDEDQTTSTTPILQQDGSPAAAAVGTRQQILTHIYTRCQEEVEKTIPPGAALLNKLLRTTEATIRKNLYTHYLTVPSNVITAPDGSTVTLNARPVLVPLDQLASAIDSAVLQIRNVEASGGFDRESAAMMVEACRRVAKEARIVIGESYGIASTELRQWEDALEPVFRPTSPASPYIKGQY